MSGELCRVHICRIGFHKLLRLRIVQLQRDPIRTDSAYAAVREAAPLNCQRRIARVVGLARFLCRRRRHIIYDTRRRRLRADRDPV